MRSALARFGRKPAVHDLRVPRFASLSAALPPPPDQASWLADVEHWYMLGNDNAGCCVEAAIIHYLVQQSAYLNPGRGMVPSTTEAIAFYSALTGYNPDDPATDLGSLVMGDHGAMQYWLQHGVTAGGKLNKLSAYLAIDPKNPVQLKQAISIFGGVLMGIQFPARLLDQPEVPFVWRDMAGPKEGHEVFAVAYQSVGTETLYDIISWGENYRLPEAALMQIIDEAVCVYDKASLDARGVNAAGMNEATLLADMSALRAMA